MNEPQYRNTQEVHSTMGKTNRQNRQWKYLDIEMVWVKRWRRTENEKSEVWL